MNTHIYKPIAICLASFLTLAMVAACGDDDNGSNRKDVDDDVIATQLVNTGSTQFAVEYRGHCDAPDTECDLSYRYDDEECNSMGGGCSVSADRTTTCGTSDTPPSRDEVRAVAVNAVIYVTEGTGDIKLVRGEENPDPEGLDNVDFFVAEVLDESSSVSEGDIVTFQVGPNSRIRGLSLFGSSSAPVGGEPGAPTGGIRSIESVTQGG